jgi:hypothetical protein
MTRTPIDIALSAGDLEALFDEIRRYLEAVDLFRCEGHEPRWRLEGSTEVTQ